MASGVVWLIGARGRLQCFRPKYRKMPDAPLSPHFAVFTAIFAVIPVFAVITPVFAAPPDCYPRRSVRLLSPSQNLT